MQGPSDEATRLARLEQRVEDIAELSKALTPTATAVATLGVQLEHLDEDIKGVGIEVAAIRTGLADRDKQVSDERKATRTALYSLVGVLVAALISGAAAVVVALISG